MKATGSIFGGSMLVAGTCIGAGMLGLPVMTSASGFFPTLLSFLVVWVFMNLSSLAYLEVSMHFNDDKNMISMAERTLGPIGRAIAWVFFVLLLFSLMAAYTSGGTSMALQFLGLQSDNHVIRSLFGILFMLPFALVVYAGAQKVDYLNRMLMVGLVLAFIYICYTFFHASKAVNVFNAYGDTKYVWFTLPLVVTSFGYQNLIPSLKSYLNGNLNKLRLTILLGSFLPLVIYSIWEFVILFLIPTWGENGLVEVMHSAVGNPADEMIRLIEIPGHSIHTAIFWFSFFALTSSVIAVGLGVFDFLSDGLHIHKTKHGRKILTLITFVPPVLFTILFPQGFLLALKYAGIFASVILIIYPVLMAWSARYIKKLPGSYRMSGGKPVLIATLIFGLMIVLADVFKWLGLFPIPHN